MTRDEAIEILKVHRSAGLPAITEAINVALEALQPEPNSVSAAEMADFLALQARTQAWRLDLSPDDVQRLNAVIKFLRSLPTPVEPPR